MCRKKACEVEGASHYALYFAKCSIVREDDFNKNGSAGTDEDYLSLRNAAKLKDHHMSNGI